METGEEFKAHCPKCKLMLNHRVTASFNKSPVKVMCLTCKKERTIKKKYRTTKKTTEPIPYSPQKQYKVGDSVYHPKFGEGDVKGADKEKITVVFLDKERMFLHGQSNNN